MKKVPVSGHVIKVRPGTASAEKQKGPELHESNRRRLACMERDTPCAAFMPAESPRPRRIGKRCPGGLAFDRQ